MSKPTLPEPAFGHAWKPIKGDRGHFYCRGCGYADWDPEAQRPCPEPAQPERLTIGLMADVFKVLAAHGYEQGKDSKVYGRSMTALLALTRAYEGEEL